MKRLLFATAATVALAAPSAGAMQFSYSVIDPQQHIMLHLRGQILPGDTDKLVAWGTASGIDLNSVVGASLDSPGGNLWEAATIGEAVHRLHIATFVPDHATCASACFLIFAAGSPRFVATTAAVAVHSVSDAVAGENARAKAISVNVARIYKEWGVSDRIIGKMVSTPPGQATWLTASDLGEMGVSIRQPSGREVAALPSYSAGSYLPPSAPNSQSGQPMLYHPYHPSYTVSP
jgi:hypothetical protein